MSNVYGGNSRYGKDVTDLMSRLTALIPEYVYFIKKSGGSPMFAFYHPDSELFGCSISGNSTHICCNRTGITFFHGHAWPYSVSRDLISDVCVYWTPKFVNHLGSICADDSYFYTIAYKHDIPNDQYELHMYTFEFGTETPVAHNEIYTTPLTHALNNSVMANRLNSDGYLTIACATPYLSGDVVILHVDTSGTIIDTHSESISANYILAGCCEAPDGTIYLLAYEEGSLTDTPGRLFVNGDYVQLSDDYGILGDGISYDARDSLYPVLVLQSHPLRPTFEVPQDVYGYTDTLSASAFVDSSPYLMPIHSWSDGVTNELFTLYGTGRSRFGWQAYTESATEYLSYLSDNTLKNAFGGAGADVATRHITDMRTVLEWIVRSGQYTNPLSGNPYNWTDSDPDNLYYCAMGDRTEYGATGGPRYTWTRTAEEMVGTDTYDIDIGEIAECVALLESA